VIQRDPLTLEVASPLPEGLHEYESAFLKAFQETDPKARQKVLQENMVALIRQVSEKMRGFSRTETLDYYKAIMERAWQQVETADTPEVKSQKLDEGMEWTMLDRDYDGRMQRTFRGPVFVPTWWGNYDPTFRPTSLGSGSKPGGVSIPTSTPTPQGSNSLPGADFAASVVGGVQGFSSKVIGDLNTFTTRVTGVTNPPPKPSVGSSSRGGGRSGGGCACACACAGCACACAGGGR